MSKPLADEITFEQALARLEEIVQTLDTGDQSLEESLKLFEEGNALKLYCLQRLKEAEAIIEQYTEEEAPEV
jgi:exodeoxyribonuclease VII small subunit